METNTTPPAPTITFKSRRFYHVLIGIMQLIGAFFALGEIASATQPTGNQSTGLWLFVAAITIVVTLYVWYVIANIRQTFTLNGSLLTISRGPFFRRRHFSIDLSHVSLLRGELKQFLMLVNGQPAWRRVYVFTLRSDTNELDITIGSLALGTRRRFIEAVFLPLIRNPQVQKSGQLREAIHASTRSLIGSDPVDSLLPTDLP